MINPEDVDPTIGRFRNMIQTTVIPRKRPHPSSTESAADQEWASFQQATAETSSEKTSPTSKKASFTSPVKGNVFSKSPVEVVKCVGHYSFLNCFCFLKGLYDDLPGTSLSGFYTTSLSAKLGIPLPNPAPEIDLAPAPSTEPEVEHPPTGMFYMFLHS